jgi:serine/threonine protein kinase/ABC-type branched-subunit amino acid transport system substrate-binding protein
VLDRPGGDGRLAGEGRPLVETIRNKVGALLQGRYKVTGFLGRGGMGAVYQCEDLRLPGKRWAVKEMLVFDPSSQEQIEESFKREAQMLSQLRHRNLPMIVDYFIEDSKPFLVMECIEGENMAHLIQREGPASELQAMRWGLEIAQVLDYLHRQEKPVIFRDLKPDNTLITEDRHVKLVDFGLARQFDPNKRRDTQASGSVGYAPPEQWEDAAQTDERSDIYSLGATLFYVLTGRPPSPVYGSQRLRPHRPNLDAGAEAIVLKCLQPEPSQRYASTSELIRDLLLWLSKQPAAGQPKPPTGNFIAEPVPDEDGQAPALPRKASLTPRWLLRHLQITTLIFLAGASLGLRNFWQAQKPPAPVQDPVLKILASTQDDKGKARTLMEKREYSQAIDLLDKLITRYPEDAEAHIMLENAYAVLKEVPLYRIPVLTSTSGNDREGAQLYPGLALAQKQINKAGGISGHLVYLELYDCASRQDQAIEMAGKIVNDPQFQVVLGPWTSQQVIATAPIFDQGKMPALAPAASDPRVWEAGRHIFTASESDYHRVERIANYFWSSGYKKTAVFTAQDSIVSRSETSEFIDAYGKLGGQVVSQVTYSYSEAEFTNQLQSLEGKGAEAVFLAEYRSDVVLRFARLLRRDYPELPLASQVVAFSSSVALQGGKDVDGMLTSTYFHPDAPSPGIQKFAASFGATFGQLRPSHREANAYDSLMLLASVIEKVGFDKKKITDHLASMGKDIPAFAGVTGEFAPGRRLDRRPAYLVQIRDGQYRLLEN